MAQRSRRYARLGERRAGPGCQIAKNQERRPATVVESEVERQIGLQMQVPSGNRGISWHYDDTVSDIIVIAIDVGCFTIWCDNNILADARILVDDRAINQGIFTDSERGTAETTMLGSFILVKVRPHEHRIPNGGSALDHATNPDHSPFDVCIRDDTAIGQDRMTDGRGVDFTGRKKPRVNIGAVRSKKLKGGSVSVRARFASKNARIVPISSQ